MNPTSVAAPRGPLLDEAVQAMQDAVAKVIADHKHFGLNLAVWRDGKVVEISPEEAELEYASAKAQSELDGPYRHEFPSSENSKSSD